jgi:hypothetical protein
MSSIHLLLPIHHLTISLVDGSFQPAQQIGMKQAAKKSFCLLPASGLSLA